MNMQQQAQSVNWAHTVPLELWPKLSMENCQWNQSQQLSFETYEGTLLHNSYHYHQHHYDANDVTQHWTSVVKRWTQARVRRKQRQSMGNDWTSIEGWPGLRLAGHQQFCCCFARSVKMGILRFLFKPMTYSICSIIEQECTAHGDIGRDTESQCSKGLV